MHEFWRECWFTLFLSTCQKMTPLVIVLSWYFTACLSLSGFSYVFINCWYLSKMSAIGFCGDFNTVWLSTDTNFQLMLKKGYFDVKEVLCFTTLLNKLPVCWCHSNGVSHNHSTLDRNCFRIQYRLKGASNTIARN